MSETRNQKMEGLQDLLIDEFIRRIQDGDATAADLSAARQFLKDNNISAQVTDENPLAKLVEVLPFRDENVDPVVVGGNSH